MLQYFCWPCFLILFIDTQEEEKGHMFMCTVGIMWKMYSAFLHPTSEADWKFCLLLRQLNIDTTFHPRLLWEIFELLCRGKCRKYWEILRMDMYVHSNQKAMHVHWGILIILEKILWFNLLQGRISMWMEGRRSRRTIQPRQPQTQKDKKKDLEKKLGSGELPRWIDFVLFLRQQELNHEPKYSYYHHFLLTSTAHNFCIATWAFQWAWCEALCWYSV